MNELSKFAIMFAVSMFLSFAIFSVSGQLVQWQDKQTAASLDKGFQALQEKLTCSPAQVASERIMVVNNTVNVPVEPAPKPEVTCPVVNKKDCLQDYGYIGDVGIVSVTVICSDGSEKKVLCSDVKA